jgi:V/A-type H+/Na+-transporting ATPase subunit D
VTGTLRVPPGRAGRVWLLERLHTAERGRDLLDRKLRILRREQQRAHRTAEHTGAEWRRVCAEAETWLLRAVLLAGRRGLHGAMPDEPAQVQVTWTVVMGVQHPQEPAVRCGRPVSDAAPAGTAALVEAATAYRDALGAAARHAVAEETARRMDAEVAATGHRLRAVEDRWIPRLRDALFRTELDLEELEHAEGVRLRWAAGHRPGAPRPASAPGG